MFGVGCHHNLTGDILADVNHAMLINKVITPPPNARIFTGIPIFKSIKHYWDLIEEGYDFKTICTCCLEPEHQSCSNYRMRHHLSDPDSLGHQRTPSRRDLTRRKKQPHVDCQYCVKAIV